MNQTTRRKSTTASGGANTNTNPYRNERKDATRAIMEQKEIDREERRQAMIQRKQARKKEIEDNIARGNPGDIDFIGMVREWRQENIPSNTNTTTTTATIVDSINPSRNICIAVRKRPISDKERHKNDHDSVSVVPPKSITVHSANFKVDGITKCMEHKSFHFDHSFGESSTTTDIYIATTLPLVDHVVRTQGRATVFAYGQTGSGKTYTMNGIQQILAYDLYGELQRHENLEIHVAFFELYGGWGHDLLHGRNKLKFLEDAKGEINVTGLQEVAAPTPEDFLCIIEKGHGSRTTHMTEANDTSSRSHAICQVFLRDKYNGKLRGKLALVDLAGSERGSDTKSHNTQRRNESSEINTSLLSLKECIRALGQKSAHVPYRQSTLTKILKDCFSPESKTTMITTISPGSSSADHSLNTLRYADRIKEKKAAAKKPSRTSTGVGKKNRRAASAGPTRERLERIFSAIGLADQHHHDSINEVLDQNDAALSPTGLAVSNAKSSGEGGSSADFGSQDSDEFEDFSTPNPSLVDDSVEGVSKKQQRQDETSYEAYLVAQSSSSYEPLVTQDTTESAGIPATLMASPSRDTVRSAMSQETAETYFSARQQEPTKEEEAELRRTVQALFELEESLLNQHMSNIQENAEMLTHEGNMLNMVQSGSMSEEEMDNYAIQLAEYLDRKEALIHKCQVKLVEFKKQLAKEQQLTQRVTRLTQY